MKDLERDDPMALVGVGYPTSADDRADRELARCITEEYALMGFTAHEVGRLFESPAYAAPHGVLRRRGPEFVREVIREVYG